MKKLLFGLIAIVMFSAFGNAQVKLTADGQSSLGAQMIILVRTANATIYTKGMSQADFMKVVGPVKVTETEKALFDKMYTYLSVASSDSDILKGDNSSLMNFVKTKTVTHGTSTVNSGKWCWSCIGEWIIKVLEIVLPYIG